MGNKVVGQKYKENSGGGGLGRGSGGGSEGSKVDVRKGVESAKKEKREKGELP